MKILRSRSRDLTANNFDEFIAPISSSALIGEDLVILDLRELDFIDLFAMAGLAYLCQELEDNVGCRVKLELGEAGACGFLPRAGFFDVLPPTVDLSDFPMARVEVMRYYRGSNPAFLELTRIDSFNVIDDILDKFIHILQRRLKYPRHETYDIAIVLSELCHNILDHNSPAAEGVAAMQVYNGQAGRFIQVIVGDRGHGIRETLRRNQAYTNLTSDTDAILRSVDLGVSEHDDQIRGNGLYHLLELTFKHQGAVHIRSGTGKVYFRMDRREYHVFSVPRLQGTQFSITFPAKMPQ